MNPKGMTKFPKRIGENDAEKMLKTSLMVNAAEITEKEMKQMMAAAAYDMRRWMNKKAFFFFCLPSADAGHAPRKYDV